MAEQVIHLDDLEAIRTLLLAYATAIDEGRFDDVAHLFDRATLRTAGRVEPLRTFDEVRGMFDDVLLYDGVPRTRHVVANVKVEVSADRTTATSWCYITVFQAGLGFPMQAVLVSVYEDRFARETDVGDSARWYFTDRLITPTTIGDLSRHMRPNTGVNRV